MSRYRIVDSCTEKAAVVDQKPSLMQEPICDFGLTYFVGFRSHYLALTCSINCHITWQHSLASLFGTLLLVEGCHMSRGHHKSMPARTAVPQEKGEKSLPQGQSSTGWDIFTSVAKSTDCCIKAPKELTPV